MSASSCCKGEILREREQWFCVCCGYTSTAWSTQHQPLQPQARNYLSCLRDLVAEAEAQERSVGAAA